MSLSWFSVYHSFNFFFFKLCACVFVFDQCPFLRWKDGKHFGMRSSYETAYLLRVREGTT